jgi:hypothetical protein
LVPDDIDIQNHDRKENNFAVATQKQATVKPFLPFRLIEGSQRMDAMFVLSPKYIFGRDLPSCARANKNPAIY